MDSPSKLPPRRTLGNLGGRSRPMSMFDVPTAHLKNLQQIGENGTATEASENSTTSKQAKRRSLLPTFNTRKTPAETKTAVESKERSIGIIREDTSDSEFNSRPPTQNSSRASTESNANGAMLPPPKPSRTSSLRTPSLRPLGSAISSRGGTSHARTTSKGVNGTPKRTSPPGSPEKASDTGHKRTDSARLPQSRLLAPSPTGQQAISTRASSVRTSTSSIAQKRSSVLISKPPVIDTFAAPSGTTQPSPTSPNRSSSRPNARTQMPPPSRPTFSTYQQHYSPAKTALPKPPVPTSKHAKQPSDAAPAVSEPEIVLTLENVLEQIDLLQLSLMHQDSTQVMRDYQAYAKHKLGRRHAKLRKDYESIRDLEREHRRTANLEALEKWCPDPALLTEHLQTLAMVASELRSHTEPGSRFSELTESFDKWSAKARAILLGNEPASYIEALPESWRSAHTSLALKCRSIQRSLSTLPPVPPRRSQAEISTSLETLLRNCSALVDGMIKELEIMTKLQKEVLQRGKVRIDEQIDALVRTTDAERNIDKENWKPAWAQVAT